MATDAELTEGLAQSMARELGPLGAYYADIYRTAYRTFTVQNLARIAFKVTSGSNAEDYSGGLDNDGKPVVHMGRGRVSPIIKQRLTTRMNLPAASSNVSDDAFKPIILAHEFGHVIQSDKVFPKIFGTMNHTPYDPYSDYKRYLESDKEVNADYIGAVILGRSDFGHALGVSPVTIRPREWREWAANIPRF